MNSALFSHALLIVRGADGKTQSQHRLSAQPGAQPGAQARLTIGRSLDCDVILNDPHVAAHHAEILFDENGQLQLRDLGSVNGTWLNPHEAIHQVTSIHLPSQLIRLGRTQIELLAQGEEVAPELPLADTQHITGLDHIHPWINRFNSRILLAISSILMIVYGGFSFWSSRTSLREIWVNIASSLFSGAIAILIWVALWALISRVANGRPRWILHACITLCVGLVFVFFDELLDVVSFATSSIATKQVMWWLSAAFGSLLLFMHLRAATHLKPVRAISLALFLPALFLVLSYWQAYGTTSGREARQTQPVVMLPPALRVLRPDAPSRLLEEAKGMKAEAISLRDKAQAEGNEDAGFDAELDD